ncbi:hypothetical protein H6F88_30505 [Oculatella sp. FACHB-28]|uniref:hypothetical protein n=1 Tax=Oculatella sp. FACHB-28 TaxID=2692845 RepID=UPI0016861DA4|nr:hypothetical protein [Oculatella sp. FACHB-28]MBD2060279.1 hypothetical protein [Oculatella sp. FACHB-28]
MSKCDRLLSNRREIKENILTSTNSGAFKWMVMAYVTLSYQAFMMRVVVVNIYPTFIQHLSNVYPTFTPVGVVHGSIQAI